MATVGAILIVSVMPKVANLCNLLSSTLLTLYLTISHRSTWVLLPLCIYSISLRISDSKFYQMCH